MIEPSEIVAHTIFVGLVARYWLLAPPKPRPIAKGSPIYTPPAEIPSAALARILKRQK